MNYDPNAHHRRSVRLKGFDYSQTGAYFITLVTQGRECLFGEISDGDVSLNAAGVLVNSWWRRLPDKFPSISADTYVVMPNHLHGIIIITDLGQTRGSAPTLSDGIVGADLRVRPDGDGVRPHDDHIRPGLRVRPDAPISRMVQWIKTMTTNEYMRRVRESGWGALSGRLWQRNYYEHVIRDAADHGRAHSYIEANPVLWTEDEENPASRRRS